jgi:hypothetical protein
MSERRAESNFFLRYWEIIVFGIAIIFSAGGLWWSNINLTSRVCATELKCEKIPVMESQYCGIDKRLDRIEKKIDNLKR